MDFMERIFGISPDNGSGLFELSFFVLPMLVFAGLYLLRHVQRNSDN